MSYKVEIKSNFASYFISNPILVLITIFVPPIYIISWIEYMNMQLIVLFFFFMSQLIVLAYQEKVV